MNQEKNDSRKGIEQRFSELEQWILTAIGGVVLVVLLICLVPWSIQVSRDWAILQRDPTVDTKKKFDASLEIAKAIVGGIGTVATIAGGVVLFLNFRIAQKKLEQETEKAKTDAKLAESRLTMDRFSKAIEMLGSDKSIHLRLGGIYALKSIALDSSDDSIDEDYRQVFEVLTAFVRENSPYPPQKPVEKASTHPLKPSDVVQPEAIPALRNDIQAALTVLNRRKHKDNSGEDRLDLSKTDLRKANLWEANLQMANLMGANLKEALLCKANLQGASLLGANLQGADLWEVNFQGAWLEKANLQGANLRGASLQKCGFWEANLQGANLEKANLQEAWLKGADLQKADLRGVNLQEADLREANLQEADLGEANLQEADLRGANLQEANLGEANLQEANLRRTNLQEASLWKANLQGTNLEKANLQKADLREVNLQGAVLLATDLRQAQELTQEQLEGEDPPLLCHAALPEGFPDKDTLKDRDCDKMPAVLHERYPQKFTTLDDAKQYVDKQRNKQW